MEMVTVMDMNVMNAKEPGRDPPAMGKGMSV